MKSINLIFLIVALVTANLYGQLPRRAFLGTQLMDVNDSIASVNQLAEKKGVLVIRVVDNSSAAVLGIQAHDLILSIDGNKMNAAADVVGYMGMKREGEHVRVDLLRDGTPLHRMGTLKPLPAETSPNAEVIYDEVAFDGGSIRIIIHRPESAEKMPALFFIQGYPCYSMDRMHEHHPYTKLFNGLTGKGYVVIKTEKAGAGDSKTMRDCSEYDLFDEIDLFSASYNSLLKYDFIDHDHVFVFGHSMGGVQAPLLKTDFPPKGIAVYGTVIRPWFEYFIEHARMQKYIMGRDYLEIEAMHETAIRFYYQLMIEKQTPRELATDPEINAFMNKSFGYDGEEHFHGRHYTFWQQLQDTRLFSAWAHTPAHVLSLWGEGEFIAFNPYEHELIANVVNRYNPGMAEFVSVPNMDHGFLWVEDQQHAVRVNNDWSYIPQHFNDQIVAILHQWMDRLCNE